MNNSELIVAIILDDPLYKTRLVKGRVLQNVIGYFGPINYKCAGKCKSQQTFGLKTVNKDDPSEYQQNMRMIAALSHMSRTPDLKYVERNSTYHLELECLKCKKYNIFFSLLMDFVVNVKDQDDDAKGTTTIQKIGQYPSFEAAIDPDVEKWLTKDDKELYSKGLRSEANGYGIGAFAYFRRITEANIEKLLNQVAATTDDQELIDAITLAKNQHNAEDRLKIVKDHAPSSFSHNGQNVFKILYNALSAGLHKATDEKCLDSATSVRVCLNFLIKRVHRNIEEQKELASSIKKLTSK